MTVLLDRVADQDLGGCPLTPAGPGEAGFARAVAEAPWALLFVDEAGRIAYANEALAELAGMACEPLIGRPLQGLCLPPASKQLRVQGGSWHYYAGESGLTTLPDGLGAGRDWLALLERELSRCRRYGSPLSLLVLWLPAAASTPLRQQELAYRLRDGLRWVDLIARDGRGEFVLILPETGEAALGALRDKLAANLGENFPELELGAAAWSRGDDAFGLLQRARAARVQLQARPA